MVGSSIIWYVVVLVDVLNIIDFSDETFNNVNSELRELPPVELSSLPLILKVPAHFTSCLTY